MGRIKDISEYHRYNDGYKNKRKGLIMFIEFTQDYRDFVQNNGAQKTQSQGMVVEYKQMKLNRTNCLLQLIFTQEKMVKAEKLMLVKEI